ncbi:cyanophycinase [Hyalella azteca]|uniref:Cyanophycinase n=1 Tax=Hyalella azteca TaxID=294128 RepID=A0A8B7NZC9_HYAAZ|nr:cyanophycinase [Hyalella azteca]
MKLVHTLAVCLHLWAIISTVYGGNVMLVGGGLTDENAAVWSRFIELAGGQGVARVGVITTASATPEDSATYYQDMFLAYGAASVDYIPITERSHNANDAAVADLVASQTGLFMGGGDQARILAGWVNADGSDTASLSALRGVLAAGGIVGGTSAGAACQGTGPMIDGGLSYNAVAYGAYAGGYNPDYPDDLCYIEDGGLGLVRGYVVDTHFSQRGREARLIELLLDTKTSDPSTQVAIGVDEDTGVLIAEDGTAEILGSAGGAMVVSVAAAVKDPAAPHTRTAGVRVSYFTEGDVFNLYDDSVVFPNWKTSITGNEQYIDATSSNNIFSSPNKLIREYGVFRDVAHRLWDSKVNTVTSYSYETGPTFSVTMKKEGGSAVVGDSPTLSTRVVSYLNMEVGIDYTILEEQ